MVDYYCSLPNEILLTIAAETARVTGTPEPAILELNRRTRHAVVAGMRRTIDVLIIDGTGHGHTNYDEIRARRLRHEEPAYEINEDGDAVFVFTDCLISTSQRIDILEPVEDHSTNPVLEFPFARTAGVRRVAIVLPFRFDSAGVGVFQSLQHVLLLCGYRVDESFTVPQAAAYLASLGHPAVQVNGAYPTTVRNVAIVHCGAHPNPNVDNWLNPLPADAPRPVVGAPRGFEPGTEIRLDGGFQVDAWVTTNNSVRVHTLALGPVPLDQMARAYELNLSAAPNSPGEDAIRGIIGILPPTVTILSAPIQAFHSRAHRALLRTLANVTTLTLVPPLEFEDEDQTDFGTAGVFALNGIPMAVTSLSLSGGNRRTVEHLTRHVDIGGPMLYPNITAFYLLIHVTLFTRDNQFTRLRDALAFFKRHLPAVPAAGFEIEIFGRSNSVYTREQLTNLCNAARRHPFPELHYPNVRVVIL